MRAPKVRSSTSGTITSAGGPAAMTRAVQRDQVRQVGGHAVEVVGGQHDRQAVAVEVVEQVQHLVAGADVDAGGRLVHAAAAAAGAAARGRGTCAAAGRRTARGCGGRARSPMPSRSRTVGDLGASPRGVGPRAAAAAVGRAMSTHSRDRDREVPVDGLELRDVRHGDARAARTTVPRCGRDGAEQQAQQRGLARPGRPDDAGERRRARRRGRRRRSTGGAVVAEASTPRPRRAAPVDARRGHCG